MDTDVTETPERDRGLLGLVERILKRPEPAQPTVAVVESNDGLDPEVIEEASPESLEPDIAVESTRELTRAQLANVIIRALQGIQGCPPHGFEIIIYGHHPWNAMLRITPAAGAMRDAPAWHRRVEEMVQLLRAQYELAD